MSKCLYFEAFDQHVNSFFCPQILSLSVLYKIIIHFKLLCLKNNINQIVCHSLYNFPCFMLSVICKILQINSILVIIKAISYLSYSYINIQLYMRKKQRAIIFLDVVKICLICRKILKVKLTNLFKKYKINYLLQIH